MNTNKDMVRERPNRKLATGFGLLTSLVLFGAAGILVTDLVLLLGAESPPANAAAAPVAPAVAKAAASAEMPWNTFLGKTILIVTSIVAVAVIAPLVGALCLFGLLRRYGKQLGPLIHVEYTSPPVVVGPFTAGALGSAAAGTAQLLNLGPSFEEERLRKAELTGRMEAGVVGQLFEDNLKLRKKIEIAREKDQKRI
jgi:hypothetical protein